MSKAGKIITFEKAIIYDGKFPNLKQNPVALHLTNKLCTGIDE